MDRRTRRLIAILKFKSVLGFCLFLTFSHLALADVTLMSGQGLGNGEILIHSEIKPGDYADFAKLAGNTHNILVTLDSPGGDVNVAVKIGRLIRQNFMFTEVAPTNECASACVFIFQAGVARSADFGSTILVHRPTFPPQYFASLTDGEARKLYNAMVADLQKYFVVEMGGTYEAFSLIMATPNIQPRTLTSEELDRLGITGQDPMFQEYEEAKMISEYGKRRWPLLKQCMEYAANLQADSDAKRKAYKACTEGVYKRYPTDN